MERSGGDWHLHLARAADGCCRVFGGCCATGEGAVRAVVRLGLMREAMCLHRGG